WFIPAPAKIVSASFSVPSASWKTAPRSSALASVDMSPPKIHPRCAGPVLAEVAVAGGDSKDRTGTVKSVLSCVNVRRFMVASPRGSGMSGLENGPMCERSQECTQKSSSWEGRYHKKARPEGQNSPLASWDRLHFHGFGGGQSVPSSRR